MPAPDWLLTSDAALLLAESWPLSSDTGLPGVITGEWCCIAAHQLRQILHQHLSLIEMILRSLKRKWVKVNMSVTYFIWNWILVKTRPKGPYRGDASNVRSAQLPRTFSKGKNKYCRNLIININIILLWQDVWCLTRVTHACPAYSLTPTLCENGTLRNSWQSDIRPGPEKFSITRENFEWVPLLTAWVTTTSDSVHVLFQIA